MNWVPGYTDVENNKKADVPVCPWMSGVAIITDCLTASINFV